MASLDVGDLRAAESDGETAIELLRDAGSDWLADTTAGILAGVLTRRGAVERARALLAAHGLDGDLPERMFFNPVLFLRAELRLAERRFEEAERDARELGRRHERWRMSRPSPPWRSACALALAGQERFDEARALALEDLALARAWDTPKAIAYATRAVAHAVPRDEQLERLREVVGVLDGTPWRFDRAVGCVDLGSALRRIGDRRAGRELLALGMHEADACGAEALVERAAGELRASGARPRRRAISGVDALTPSERRVADLALAGHTNREIAQELFVTMATVETHLSRAYRKLGITGRADLAGALA